MLLLLLPAIATAWASPSFGFVEESQLDSDRKINFGHFLDTGKGLDLLRWWVLIVCHDCGAGCTDGNNNGNYDAVVLLKFYTAVTANEEKKRRVADKANKLSIAREGLIIDGNWKTRVDKTMRKLPTVSKRGKEIDYLIEGSEQLNIILSDYLVSTVKNSHRTSRALSSIGWLGTWNRR